MHEACGADAGLRRQVKELLAAHDAAGTFLSGGAAELAAPLVAGEGGEHRLPSSESPAAVSAQVLGRALRMRGEEERGRGLLARAAAIAPRAWPAGHPDRLEVEAAGLAP